MKSEQAIHLVSCLDLAEKRNPNQLDNTGTGPAIGLSLSACIRDIVDGRVSPDQVLGIAASIEARSEEEFKGVTAKYVENFWGTTLGEDVANKYGALALSMYNGGLIIQPRLLIPEKYPSGILRESGNWVFPNEQLDRELGARILSLSSEVFGQ